MDAIEDADADPDSSSAPSVPTHSLHATLPYSQDLVEIGGQAVWSVTTAKAGNGVDLLRDNKEDTYWQSDGPQPHLVSVQFQRKVRVQYVALFLDFKHDESYTPQRVSVRAGTSFHDLKEISSVEVEQPQGWILIYMRPPNPEDEKEYLKTFFLQIAILRNHQSGRDTHVRQIKVFGPRHEATSVQGGRVKFGNLDFASYCSIR